MGDAQMVREVWRGAPDDGQRARDVRGASASSRGEKYREVAWGEETLRLARSCSLGDGA